MKSILPTLLFLFFYMPSLTNAQQSSSNKDSSTTRYIKDSLGYLMVLRQGDNLFNELEKFATRENIPSANFTGMGFVNIQFGFFDFAKKEYKPKDIQNVELASMHGTIAWQKGKVSIHAHGVVGDKDFKAYAGHILAATVSTGSLEILITVHEKKLERMMDEQLGANVLQLEN